MINYKSNKLYSVNNVLNSIKQRFSTNYSRYLSWEDCYNAFFDVRNKDNTEYLALHLTGYLSSWGMYRGSSDLLREYCYLIHKNLIPLLYSPKYLPLFNINKTNFEHHLPLITSAYSDIEKFYNCLKSNNKQFRASETLITKIMLGVYGCVPAYDRFLCEGLKHYGIQRSGTNKFKSLNDWLSKNRDFVSDVLAYGKANFNNYPFMKLVDMYFWELGWQIAEKK